MTSGIENSMSLQGSHRCSQTVEKLKSSSHSCMGLTPTWLSLFSTHWSSLVRGLNSALSFLCSCISFFSHRTHICPELLRISLCCCRSEPTCLLAESSLRPVRRDVNKNQTPSPSGHCVSAAMSTLTNSWSFSPFVLFVCVCAHVCVCVCVWPAHLLA